MAACTAVYHFMCVPTGPRAAELLDGRRRIRVGYIVQHCEARCIVRRISRAPCRRSKPSKSAWGWRFSGSFARHQIKPPTYKVFKGTGCDLIRTHGRHPLRCLCAVLRGRERRRRRFLTRLVKTTTGDGRVGRGRRPTPQRTAVVIEADAVRRRDCSRGCGPTPQGTTKTQKHGSGGGLTGGGPPARGQGSQMIADGARSSAGLYEGLQGPRDSARPERRPRKRPAGQREGRCPAAGGRGAEGRSSLGGARPGPDGTVRTTTNGDRLEAIGGPALGWRTAHRRELQGWSAARGRVDPGRGDELGMARRHRRGTRRCRSGLERRWFGLLAVTAVRPSRARAQLSVLQSTRRGDRRPPTWCALEAGAPRHTLLPELRDLVARDRASARSPGMNGHAACVNDVLAAIVRAHRRRRRGKRSRCPAPPPTVRTASDVASRVTVSTGRRSIIATAGDGADVVEHLKKWARLAVTNRRDLDFGAARPPRSRAKRVLSFIGPGPKPAELEAREGTVGTKAPQPIAGRARPPTNDCSQRCTAAGGRGRGKV